MVAPLAEGEVLACVGDSKDVIMVVFETSTELLGSGLGGPNMEDVRAAGVTEGILLVGIEKSKFDHEF